ncbi:unnamed protein product [Auanema sp. JU1783]|nr:unnamed protein product [Auanema sp. JU1783]
MGDQNALLRFLAAQVTQQQQQQQISAALSAINGLSNNTSASSSTNSSANSVAAVAAAIAAAASASSSNSTTNGLSNAGSVSAVNGTTPQRNGQRNASAAANGSMNQLQELLLWQMIAAQQAQAQLLNMQQIQQQTQQSSQQSQDQSQRLEWLQKELIPKELARQQQKLKQQLDDQQKQQQQQQQQQKAFDDVIRKLAETAKNGQTNGQTNGRVSSTPIDKPSTSTGATATIREGAEIKLENGETPKKSSPPKSAANPFNKNAIDAAMWQLLAAQMLQQQNVLKNATSKQNKVTIKKDPYSAGLDIAAKIKAEQQAQTTKSENINSTVINSFAHLDSSDANKKRLPATETQARIPLGLGWRRQTCIRAVTASGVRGDVIYYAPCGKKLSTYAEVLRYLIKNNCGPITRDNFSFSSKLIVGEFIYPKDSVDGEKRIFKLTEEEVNDEVNKLASLKSQPRITEKKFRDVKDRASSPDEDEFVEPEEYLAPKGFYDDEEKVKWSREPIDDLLLTEIRPLPEMQRIPNLQLKGEGFADALMVYEFIKNFGVVLKIDVDSMPPLDEFCAGLAGDLRYSAAVLDITKVLFTLALEFPGFPVGRKGQNSLGMNMNNYNLTRENFSLVLMQFLSSRDEQGQKLAKLVENEEFETLVGEDKASILAFLCNELLCCRNIVREIDSNLDEIGKLKGDRWLRDGKARALKAHQKRRKRELKKDHKEHDEDGEERPASRNSDSEEDESTVHPNNKKLTPGLGQVEILTNEEENMSVEELEQVIINLKLESDDLKDEINKLANRVRSFPFGWDRYHRQYWQLPHVPTILVESIESCGLNNPACNISETCDKDPDSYETSNYLDPDVYSCLEDLIDETALMRVKIDKKHKKKIRRFDNSFKRGWWMIDSKEVLESVRSSLHGRGIRERCLHRLLCKNWFMKDIRIGQFELLAPSRLLTKAEIEKDAVHRLESAIARMEHQVFNYQITSSDWKPLSEKDSVEPAGSSDEPWRFNESLLDDDDASSLTLDDLRTRILDCEQAIDNRYFEPSFFVGYMPSAAIILGLTSSDESSEAHGSPNGSEGKLEIKEESTDEKMDGHEERMEDDKCSEHSKGDDRSSETKEQLIDKWRQFVEEATTPSQLMMAVECLLSSIAWDRSVVEAICQICKKLGAPEVLLHCVGCQRGYHLRCFRPGMDTYPESWFCPRCKEQASGNPHCVFCVKDGAPIYPCRVCQNFYHIECSKQHTPDRPSDFVCLFCDDKDLTESHRVVLRTESEEPKENEEVPHVEESSGQKDARKPQKRKADGPPPIVFPQEMAMDLCRTMLDEIELQPTVGPFLEPVDTDLVPGYKETIPNPIDISTIRNKIDSQCYDSPDDFAIDVELMFTNCRTFNEDNSPVGVAGQNLYKFFQKRWKQVKYNYSKRLRRMQAAQASN